MISKSPSNTDAVVSDTSCFILFEKIGALDLLRQCFRNVYTTQTVADEFGIPLPQWVEIRNVIDQTYLLSLMNLADPGEISVIALAKDIPDCLLIPDDGKAKKLARSLDLAFMGTLGILVRAKAMGFVPSLRPLIDKIRLTDFRTSEDLYRKVLTSVNETYE